MKNFLLLIFILTVVENSYGQYISPGLRLGYDFNSHTTFEWKVSVGFNSGGNIYNVTMGKKYAINKKETYTSHNYLDLQFGDLSKTFGERKTQLFYGGGIGVVFYEKDGIRKYHPRVTAFTGFLLFTTFDLYMSENKNIETDLGLQLVAPIPLGGIDFGSPGG